jgi:hypothetical protein
MSSLTELWYFSASNNQIAFIHPALFAGLTKLSCLYFENNQLTTLDSSLFSGLDKLFLLRFDGNQLTSLDGVIFSSDVKKPAKSARPDLGRFGPGRSILSQTRPSQAGRA